MKNPKGIIMRLLVMILIIAQLASIQGIVVMAAENSTKIVNLKTNDMVNPLGIDQNPRFSWQMLSDVVGQCQSAYQITVASDEELEAVIWDSGKVTSGISTGIVYEGEELEASTKYYWSVDIWDKDDKLIEAQTASFEMGLLGTTTQAWEGSSWISAGVEAPPEAENVHYTVEGDFTVTNLAAGMVFNYYDDNNLLMWQISADYDSGDGGGESDKVLIRPHKRVRGSWTAFDSTHKIDITELVGGVEGIKSTSAHMMVEVTETEVKTFVNDTLVDTITFVEIKNLEPVLGKIGVRSNSSESGTVANMKLIDYAESEEGVVVYDYDFSKGNPFGKGEIINGAFIINGVSVCVGRREGSDVPVFRKKLTLDNPVKSARLYVTGQGVFDVWINGERVGNRQSDGSVIYDELKPGFTRPEVRVTSFAYDVTDMLDSGDNAISALVAAGWWSGDIARGTRTLAFRAKLLVTYENGEQEVIGTDTSWKFSYNSPVIMADMFAGETYDANISMDWTGKDFNDDEWSYAVNNKWSGPITAITGPRVRVREDLERKAESITVYDGVTGESDKQYGKINVTGTYNDGDTFTIKAGEKAVVDFGQNFAGWPQLEAEGAQGTVITIKHAEMLNDNDGLIARGNDGPEGSIYTANLRTAGATAKYTMNGNGVETYHTTYSFYGFRYVEISATADITVHNVKGLVLTSVETDTGSLKTSDASINQLISNIRWGMLSNYLSIPTDCPQRDERQGWLADTQVFAVTGAYNADVKGFLTKWMLDVRDSQRDNGAFPDTAPTASYTGSGNVGWADGGIIVPYNMYKMYGDKNFITENWDAMTKYMAFLESKGEYGPDKKWGDWLAYEDNDDEIKNILGVAYYAWDAQMMADMAEVLGKADEAQKYRELYEKEKAFFIEQFINDDGTIIRPEQTACLMALKMDLLPDDNSREAVKKQLLDNISSRGNLLQTGFLGTSVIMPTLSEIGASDMAYKLLLQHNEPSWLYSVDQGATTCWERWNSYTKSRGFGKASMNSFNHYAYGAVGEWMYSYMAGITTDFDNPGFKNIILRPTFGDGIDMVECSYDSAYGTIESSWTYKNGNYTYNAKIPANTTATVYMPVTEGYELMADGKQAEELNLSADGIEYIGTEDGCAVFNMVANSEHSFENTFEGSSAYEIIGSENLKNGKMSVELKFRGIEYEEATLVAAKYSEGRLESVKTQAVDSKTSFEFSDAYETGDVVELYVWDSLKSMKPLSKTYTHSYETPKEKPVVVYSPTYEEYSAMFSSTSGEKLTEVNGLGGYGELGERNATVTYTYNDVEYTFTKGWKQGGSGSEESKCLYFTPIAPCTVIVVFDGNGSAGREQKIAQNGRTLAVAQSADPNPGVVQCKITDTSAPVYTYGGGANKNVYAIIVEYDM